MSEFEQIMQRLNRIEMLLTSHIADDAAQDHYEGQDEFVHGIRGLTSLLQISAPTAQKLKDRGVFPTYRKGRQVFFRKNEVLAGIKERQQ